MTSPTIPLVDHIVILIPYSFLSSPPSWFADLFHFYPGGRHSDGLTENTLVLLADGSYLEFIAFVPGVDPAKRAAHQWGRKKEGTVVDWAVTLLPLPAPPSPDNGDGDGEARYLEQGKAFREIQKRVRDANAGIVYGDLKRGGRARPDGEVLKWGVAFPRHDKQAGGGPVEPGTVPFWCLDVTARHLRVPYTDPGVTKHPIGAVGVANVEVLPDSKDIAESARVVYDTILDVADTNGSWNVGSPVGATVHSGGTVRLGASEGSARVNITFFTDDPSLVGKSVGGKVDDDNTLTFHLVAAFDRRV